MSNNGQVSYPLGDLDLEIFGKASPKAAGTFLELVKGNGYAGKTFHRIIRGFCIQAGQGVEVPSYDDDSEGLAMKFGVGALAMSNGGEPNSGNGEFFITTARADELDGKYVIIGRVSDSAFKTMREIEKCGDVDGDIFNDVKIQASQLIS